MKQRMKSRLFAVLLSGILCAGTMPAAVYGEAFASEIPDSVTEIGEGAFCQCEKLTSLVLQKNLKVVSADLCYGNTVLASVTIPEGVTEIDTDAFGACKYKDH